MPMNKSTSEEAKCLKQLQKMEQETQKILDEINDLEKKKAEDKELNETPDEVKAKIEKIEKKSTQVEKYFNIEHCQNLVEDAPIITEKRGNVVSYKPDLSKAIEYYKKFFFQLENGSYAQKVGKNYIVKDKNVVFETYFNKLGKDMTHYITKVNPNIYKLRCEVKYPERYGDVINTFAGFKHKIESKPKKLSEYSEDIQGAVNEMNKYVLDILCNNDKKNFQFLIKWYAACAQGKKNNAALYYKGIQGIGKSFFNEFNRNHVIGRKVSLKLGNAYTLTEKFNSILMGKVFVVYEELPTFNENQWRAVSGVLKDRITSTMGTYEAKGKDPIEAKNLNNYVIISNVEAIQDSDGRRYFILELSTKRQGDHKYFGDLYKMCCNDEVGEAYFNYLCGIDLTGWDAQKEMPENEKKIETIIANLDIEYKFLKHRFILPQKNMKHTLIELTELCKEYIKKNVSENYKFSDKFKFKLRDKLRDLGLITRHSGDRFYEYRHEDLKEIFEKKKYIHETDYEEFFENQPKTNTASKALDFTDERELELLDKIDYLEKKIKELQYDVKEYQFKCDYITLQQEYTELERQIELLREEKKAVEEYNEQLLNEIDILVGKKKNTYFDDEEVNEKEDMEELLDQIDMSISLIEGQQKIMREKQEHYNEIFKDILQPCREEVQEPPPSNDFINHCISPTKLKKKVKTCPQCGITPYINDDNHCCNINCEKCGNQFGKECLGDEEDEPERYRVCPDCIPKCSKCQKELSNAAYDLCFNCHNNKKKNKGKVAPYYKDDGLKPLPDTWNESDCDDDLMNYF